MKLAIEINEHRTSTPDRPMWVAFVMSLMSYRCYYAVYAGDRPTVDKVREDFFSDMGTTKAKNWKPYIGA